MRAWDLEAGQAGRGQQCSCVGKTGTGRVAATVREGLKLAVALLGSWPLGVPLPLSACHSGASQQQALSQALSAGQGAGRRRMRGALSARWCEGPSSRSEMGRMARR